MQKISKPKNRLSREGLFVFFVALVAFAGLLAYYFFNNKISADTEASTTKSEVIIAINNWDLASQEKFHNIFGSDAKYSCSTVTVYVSENTYEGQMDAIKSVIEANGLTSINGPMSSYIDSVKGKYNNLATQADKDNLLKHLSRTAIPSSSFQTVDDGKTVMTGKIKTSCDRGGTNGKASVDYNPPLKVPVVYQRSAASKASPVVGTGTTSPTATTSETDKKDSTTEASKMIIPKINVYMDGKKSDGTDKIAIVGTTILAFNTNNADEKLAETATNDANFLTDFSIDEPSPSTTISKNRIKIYATKKSKTDPNITVKSREVELDYVKGNYANEVNLFFSADADIDANSMDTAAAQPLKNPELATLASTSNIPDGSNTVTFFAARASETGTRNGHTPVGGVKFKINFTTTEQKTSSIFSTGIALAQNLTENKDAAVVPASLLPYDNSVVQLYSEPFWQKLIEGLKSLATKDYKIEGTIPDNGTSSAIQINNLPTGVYRLELSKGGYESTEWIFNIPNPGQVIALGGLPIIPKVNAEAPSIETASIVTKKTDYTIYNVEYKGKKYVYNSEYPAFGWQAYKEGMEDLGMQKEAKYDGNGIPYAVDSSGNRTQMIGSTTNDQFLAQYQRCMAVQTELAGGNSDLADMLVGLGLGYFADSDTGTRNIGKFAKSIALSTILPKLTDKFLGTNLTGADAVKKAEAIIKSCNYIIYGETINTPVQINSTQPVRWKTASECKLCSSNYGMCLTDSSTDYCKVCLTRCIESNPAILGITGSALKAFGL